MIPRPITKKAVEDAVGEIKDHFPDAEITAREDGSGGAYVLVSEVPLAKFYLQRSTWVGFHITHTCPFADVYPHFVRPDLAYADGNSLCGGLSSGQEFEQRKAIQISRRSNHHNSNLDTPLIKLQKVIKWLNTSPQ